MNRPDAGQAQLYGWRAQHWSAGAHHWTARQDRSRARLRGAPRQPAGVPRLTCPADSATPIGAGCRVCERDNCPQRAFPALGRALDLDEHRSTVSPYLREGEPVSELQRIPAGGRRELGLLNWAIARVAARSIRAPQMHLFTTLGQQQAAVPVLSAVFRRALELGQAAQTDNGTGDPAGGSSARLGVRAAAAPLPGTLPRCEPGPAGEDLRRPGRRSADRPGTNPAHPRSTELVTDRDPRRGLSRRSAHPQPPADHRISAPDRT